MPANQLKVNGTTYDINDIRVSIGTAAPSDSAGGATNGNIYIRNVAVGTSNGWSYIIRPDGYAECWTRIDCGSPSFGTWGVMHSVDNPTGLTALNFPVTFTEVPVVTASVAGGSVTTFTNAGNTTSKTRAAACGACTMGSGGSVVVCYHAIGKV